MRWVFLFAILSPFLSEASDSLFDHELAMKKRLCPPLNKIISTLPPHERRSLWEMCSSEAACIQELFDIPPECGMDIDIRLFESVPHRPPVETVLCAPRGHNPQDALVGG